MLYLNLVFIIIFSAYLYWLWGLLRALKSDAPFVPIGEKPLRRMIEFAQAKPGDLWIDMGSGDGRILIAAARALKVRGLGIERVGSLRLWSRLRIARAGLSKQIRIHAGNFFDVDVSKADIVSFYLLPDTNRRLLEKFRHELKPGAKIVWHRHQLDGVLLEKEDKELKVYLSIVGKF